LTLPNFELRRKRKAEDSADEARRVEAAASLASVKSPPRIRARLEAVQEEEDAAAEAGETSAKDAEKAASVDEVRTPPMSPSSVPPKSLGREPFLADRGQAPPNAHPVGQQEAGRGEEAGLVEELLAAARRTAESAEVSALNCFHVFLLCRFCSLLIAFFLSVPGRPKPASRREAAKGAGRRRPTRAARVPSGGAGGTETPAGKAAGGD